MSEKVESFAYIVKIYNDEVIIVIAENIQNVCDKLEDLCIDEYQFIKHKSYRVIV